MLVYGPLVPSSRKFTISSNALYVPTGAPFYPQRFLLLSILLRALLFTVSWLSHERQIVQAKAYSSWICLVPILGRFSCLHNRDLPKGHQLFSMPMTGLDIPAAFPFRERSQWQPTDSHVG